MSASYVDPFYSLRVDPNVVLSLKTVATTLHYHLRVPPIFHFSLSLSLFLFRAPLRWDASAISAGRDIARARSIFSVLFSQTLVCYSLPSPLSHDLHYTRGAQHTVPMTTRSLSASCKYIASSRVHLTTDYLGESTFLADGRNARARTRYITTVCASVCE